MPLMLLMPDARPYLSQSIRVKSRREDACEKDQSCLLGGKADQCCLLGGTRYGRMLHGSELAQKNSGKNEIASTSQCKKGRKEPDAMQVKQ